MNGKDYELQQLYEVVTSYGSDRDKVIVKTKRVVAESPERAMIVARNDVDAKWDMDYVTQHVDPICEIRVKLKPREILASK